MNEHSASAKAETKDADAETAQTRQRSAIQFPYNHFDDAAKIAGGIHDNVGNGTCAPAQLAAWTSQSPKSSGFRMQLAAARLFGLIEGEGETLRLAALGKQLHDPNTSRKAKADAFLNVPLFAALYQSHKDGVLPPAAALEREIAELGVAVKQKDRARQVFERSADQTGFFAFGKNRLVMPAIAVKDGDEKKDEIPKGGGGGGGGGTGGGNGGKDELGLDPLLLELLRKIPRTGEAWPKDKRIRWFKTFAMNVSQVYDDENEPVEIFIAGIPTADARDGSAF